MRKKQQIYTLLILLATLLILGQLFIVVDKHTPKALAQGNYKLPTPTLNPPTSSDSIESPPTHRPIVTDQQASQTTISYQLPVVKFRVDSGDDLDQYLYGNMGPLDFYIDLQGFTPPVTQSTKITLKVWDIDEAGNPSNPACLVEVDKLRQLKLLKAKYSDIIL